MTGDSVSLWLLFVKTFAYFRDECEQRNGQAAFNALTVTDPALAHKMRGTDLDPFHNDERAVDFINEVERWYFSVDPAP